MDLVTLILSCSLYSNNAVVDAMIHEGSKNDPTLVTVTIPNQSPIRKKFKSINAAAQFAQNEANKGYDVEIGLMQIPYVWLNEYKNRVALTELFRPCKNVVIATDILNRALQYCSTAGTSNGEMCALSLYKTGSMTAGKNYAEGMSYYAANHRELKDPLLFEASTANEGFQIAPHLPSDLGAMSPQEANGETDTGVDIPNPSFDTEGES